MILAEWGFDISIRFQIEICDSSVDQGQAHMTVSANAKHMHQIRS